MKKNKRAGWKAATRLTHSPEVVLPPGNKPILPPIYQTAKFAIAPGIPLQEQFFYTRIGNPTLRELELSLAEIQEQEDCIVLASGLAAITGTLLGLLKTGDHVIAFRELYRPGRIFVREMLPRFGIESTIMKLSEIHELEKFVKPNTRIIYFESPSNPHLQIADIEKIKEVAKKHNLITMMDGTFAGLHQHTNYQLDLMVQSLTKFANGHGDVVAGSVAGRRDLIEQIRTMTITLGATLDPHAAFLISRGLKTYLLRYERCTRSAQVVAEYLSRHARVKKTYYPGLPQHPLHALAQQQMQQMGAILAFEVDPSAGTALELCHKFELLQYTASVGSTESLICPTAIFFADDLNAQEREEMGLNAYSLRLSVGLEDPQDIIADLEQALG